VTILLVAIASVLALPAMVLAARAVEKVLSEIADVIHGEDD
jgi:hypothetical protein